MRRLPVRFLRSAAAAARRAPAASHGGFPATPALHPAASAAAPSSSSADLSRWPQRRGYSQFASGFTPLKPKPLESIIDVERAKGLSPEHLVAAWDDVSPCSPLLVVSFFQFVLRN
jgi:ATP synthase mitochondrial F1 complex assembly factor 1